MDLYKIIVDIENNDIIVPRMQRNIIWNRDKMKELIKSLYEGTPIGTLTFWRLSSDSKATEHYREILESEGKELAMHINLILDGLQRCSSIAAVYSSKKIAINRKFQKIDLYYNPFSDEFQFKEEIKNLDFTWINLKDTYDSSGYNSEKLKERFIRNLPNFRKMKDNDKYKTINERITRIFHILGIQIEIDTYIGQDLPFAHNLLVKRNLGTRISLLDLLHSAISATYPEGHVKIKEFSRFTKDKLGKRFQLNVHDLLHLILHLKYPGTYSSRKGEISQISLENFNYKEYKDFIGKITNYNKFEKFLNILENEIGNIFHLDQNKTNHISYLTLFKKKSSLYACFCIYLFCLNHQEKKEFHHFLGKYFLFNIVLERFNKREIDLMLDLRVLNDTSKDFLVLKKEMDGELNDKFWKETLPQNFLENKSRFSDLSMLYQLTLLHQPIFNVSNITVESFLLDNNVKSIAWINIFHKKWFDDISINHASILNKILVYYGNQSKRRFRRSHLWGWLEDILINQPISYIDGMFEHWDFPRGYEEEMKIFHKYNKQKRIKEYLNEFFKIRTEKMAHSIEKLFS